MSSITEPRLPFETIDVQVPRVAYGEFDLKALGPKAVPFKAAMFVVEPGGSTPRDEHAVRECWFVARGTGELVYDGRRSRIGTGDLLFFESHKAHYVENTGAEDLGIFSAWWPALGCFEGAQP